MEILLQSTISLSRFSSFCRSSAVILSRPTLTQKSIIFARKNKKRAGSQRSTRAALKSIAFLASNLGILPEPLNLVVREFGYGGNGGGAGILKGFGGGGFDGWRRKKKNLGFFVVLMVGFGLLLLWLVLGEKLDTDSFLGIMGFALFGISILGWRTGIKDWILGFCCCAVLLILGLRKEKEMFRWAEGFRGCFPHLQAATAKRGTTRRRRAF